VDEKYAHEGTKKTGPTLRAFVSSCEIKSCPNSPRRQQSFFRVFEFFLPPQIAVLLDQPPSLSKVMLDRFPRVRRGGDWETRRWGEISSRAISLSPTLLVSLSLFLSVSHSQKSRAVQVDVGEVQRHRAARGNLPGFVQVALHAVLACFSAEQTPLPRSREETELFVDPLERLRRASTDFLQRVKSLTRRR